MFLKALCRSFIPISPDLPSHTPGIPQANTVGNYEKQIGHLPEGRSTAERSTGIDAGAHEPILPQMPNLSPP